MMELELFVPDCTLKVDLLNAFDLVHWGFLVNVLQPMAFPSQFRDWVKVCFTVLLLLLFLLCCYTVNLFKKQGY
jgi:hypothetical protein